MISLFFPNVAVYAVPNDGGWYDFGYFLGIVVFGVGARKTQTVYRDRGHRRPRAEDRLMSNSTQPKSILRWLFAGSFILIGSLALWSMYLKTIHSVRPLWADLLVPLMMALFVLQNWLAPEPSVSPRLRRGVIVFFSALAALELVAIFALKG